MTVREMLEGLFDAWRRGDALRAAAFFTAGGVYRDPRHEPVVGREALVAHFTRFFRDGPPWRFEVDDLIVEGRRAAVRYRFRVQSSDGDWREHPGCAFVETEGGALLSWQEFDG